MRTLVLWLALLGCALGVTPLDLDGAGLSLRVPDGWSAATAGDTRLVIAPDDGSLAVVFMVVPSRELKTAQLWIRRNQVRRLGRLNAQDQRMYTVNGLRVDEESGTAPDGRRWSMSVISARQPVVVCTLATPAALARHQAGYRELMGSLKPR